jgi:glycosyltransferase involved in cell wall biosynthesis
VLVPARLSEEKGHDMLLRAFDLLRSGGTDAQLLIAGEDLRPGMPVRRRIEALRRELNLEDTVFMPGRVKPMASCLKACEVLAVPSERESFGRTVVEAWAAGVPVVSTQCGGPEELIGAGGAGLLTPVNDPAAFAAALEQVLTDPGLAAQMRQAGLERVEPFSLEGMLDAVETLYKKMKPARP